MKKYAIKVPFSSDESDMLFVTEGDSKFHLRIATFLTREEAQQHADIWSDKAVVVELNEDQELLL